MAQRRGLGGLVALLVVAGLLAGCTSKSPSKSPSDPAQAANFEDLGLQATANTGIIRGIVLDDAIRPLPSAAINTTLADGTVHNTTSAADGAFGFDGLDPGTYFLKVAKPGYLTVQASVDVVAGVEHPPIVKVLLKADPSNLPYFSAYQYDAFVACSFTLVLVSFAACGLAPDQTNNAFLVNYRADKPPQLIQTEAIWESTQPLGTSLSLSITDFSTGGQIGVNGTSGPSPIYITVNETTAAKFNYTGPDQNDITIRLFSTPAEGTDVVPEETIHALWAANGYPVYNGTGLDPTVAGALGAAGLYDPFGPSCIQWVVLFHACMGAGGVGVVFEQRVTVFTHIFYGYTPPVDWRFSNTGAPPDPPA